MKKRLVVFLALLFFATVASAQSWSDLNRKAFAAYKEGNYTTAIDLIKQALVKAESEFGKNHTNYATSLVSLAKLYNTIGRNTEAEPLYRQALEIDRKAVGEDNPAFARDLNNLAELYREMGSYLQAEPLYKQSLEIIKKALGTEHPNYAMSLNNLALLYQGMGNYAQAEPLYEQALEVMRKTLGLEHPTFATTLGNLAELYRQMGKYVQAEPLYKQTLEIKHKTSGEGHPDFALGLNNLGGLYQDMGKYAQADSLYRQALEIDRKALGEDHAAFARDLNNLAELYRVMGNYVQAEPLYKQAMEIRKRTLGAGHADFAGSLNNLALLYSEMGNYTQAEPLYIQALEIMRIKLGAEHPTYATNLNNLAELYREMGNYAQAEPLCKQALEIDRKALGTDNAAFARDLNNLAALYLQMGNYTQAEPLYIQAVEVMRKTLGKDHPAFATSLNNLAELYRQIGNYAQAEPMYRQAMEIRRKAVGESHPDFASSLNNLAGMYRVMGKYTQAETLYKQALEIKRKALGAAHADCAISLNNLAELYSVMGNYAQAESLFKQAREVIREALGIEHPSFATSLGNLAIVYMNAGEVLKAAALLDSCNHILRNNLSRNYTFLSEDEKEKYNITILEYRDAHNGFVYKNHVAVPSSVTHCFNNVVATSSLLLKSSIAMRHVINMSSDTGLKQKYVTWVELRKKIAWSSSLSIAEREKNGLDTRAMEDRAHDLEKDLVRTSAGLSDLSGKDIDFTQIRDGLNDSEAAIEFSSFRYFNGKRWTDSVMYCAYIIKSREAVPIYVPLFEEKQLQPLLARVIHSERGLKVDNGNNIAGGNAYRALYDLVWKQLEPHLVGMKTIYVTPSGLLNKLSFESIKDEAGNYLLNKYQLHHLLSSSEVVSIKDNRSIAKAKKVALFGGARFDLSADVLQQLASKTNKNENDGKIAMRGIQRNGNAFLPWKYLKGTLDEVITISKTLTDHSWSTVLDTGFLATEEQLIAVAGDNAPEILHIATHGFYSPPPKDTIKRKLVDDNTYKIASNPLQRSGIILSGANYKWVQNKDIANTQNGIVTALDISNLDFSNTNLVVLSACETGLGDIQSGEGVYGLQRAFRLAGAESMIISLWQVPDKETAEMMGLFYSTLSKGSVSYYEAFNAAQKSMQQQYPDEPIKWAAFELVGQ